jgi:hypothetical protein
MASLFRYTVSLFFTQFLFDPAKQFNMGSGDDNQFVAQLRQHLDHLPCLAGGLSVFKLRQKTDPDIQIPSGFLLGKPLFFSCLSDQTADFFDIHFRHRILPFGKILSHHPANPLNIPYRDKYHDLFIKAR